MPRRSAPSSPASASTTHPAVVGNRSSLDHLTAINRLHRNQLSKRPDRTAGERELPAQTEGARVRADRAIVNRRAGGGVQFLDGPVFSGDDVADVGRQRIDVGRRSRLKSTERGGLVWIVD